MSYPPRWASECELIGRTQVSNVSRTDEGNEAEGQGLLRDAERDPGASSPPFLVPELKV